MATKWKSKRVLLSAILLMSFGITMITSFLYSGVERVKGSYFETNDFNRAIDRFLDYVVLFDISGIDADELRSRIVVSEEEINEHRYQYGTLDEQIANIKEQYMSRIAELETMGNKEAATALIAERDAKITDITLNFTSDEHVRKKIMVEKQQLVDEMIANINHSEEEWQYYSKTFSYYLQDIDTGKIYTSLTNQEAETYKTYFSKDHMLYVQHYDELSLDSDIAHSYLFNTEDVNFTPEDSNHTYTGYIGVSDQAEKIASVVKQYKQAQGYYISAVVSGIIALLYSLLVIVKSRVFTEKNALTFPLYNKLPFDIRVIIVFGTAFACAAAILNAMEVLDYISYSGDIVSYYDWHSFIMTVVLSTAVISISAILFVFFLNSLIGRSFMEQVRTSISYKLYDVVKKGFLYVPVGIQFVILLGVFFLGGIYLGIVSSTGDLALYLFIMPIQLFIVFILFKYIGYFNQIVKNINDIVQGKNVENLDISGKSVFVKLAANVNELKQGLKISQREQVKSERLKSELITNVSHDLRTPLTSLITYSNLLKSENVTEEERRNYIDIIDRKSKRLKVLIEDLFEASKMASGNIELVKTEVEIVQLLQQAMAEYDEKIAASQLQFRVSYDDPPIYAVVDGQKLWRVFDNLIGNILNYSLPHTRVYIDVQNKQNQIDITFKNVSQYELGGNVDELFERFKRGDQSRQTEGSGLGLAIAKSIIDLHEGSMEIDVDGDLFKVYIILRK